MTKIRIAQTGCGAMGLRHLRGHIELNKITDTLDLIALCDVNLTAAEKAASEAEENLGKRPNVYTNFDEMLETEKDLDAVDIVTDPGLHHVLALKALDAGVHVAVEKPMAVTVRACRKMIEAAKHSGRYISVFENYRRDPLNRLTKAILDSGEIGDPRLMVNVKTWGAEMLRQVTHWRHLKLRGIWLLEYGVHNADLFLYLMGEVDTVYAETNLWDIEGQKKVQPLSSEMAELYDHGVREDDMALAIIKFKSGAMGHFAMSLATPGESTLTDIIYCSNGSLKLPGSRTGHPARVTKKVAQSPLTENQTLELVPGFQLDDLTAPFFQNQRQVHSYNMVFEEIDRKLLGLELLEFATAIREQHDPEVTGEVGLDAVAFVYSILESAQLGSPVPFAGVVEDQINSYQRETNEHIGL